VLIGVRGKLSNPSQDPLSTSRVKSSYSRNILAFPQTTETFTSHLSSTYLPIILHSVCKKKTTTMADYTDNDVTYHKNATREDMEELRRRAESSQQRRDTEQKAAKNMAKEMGSSAQEKRKKNKEEIAERKKAEEKAEEQ